MLPALCQGKYMQIYQNLVCTCFERAGICENQMTSQIDAAFLLLAVLKKGTVFICVFCQQAVVSMSQRRRRPAEI